MGEVVGFSCKPTAPEDDGPHLAGAAVCGACHHEWEAEAPAGVGHMECPKCRRMWGAFKHAVEPETLWRCNCGELLFWLTPTGAMCRRCGTRSNDWAG
jgi:hypothetical protein